MVVAFFLNLWVFKPTLKIIEARKGQTDNLQIEAEKLIVENRQQVEKYEKIILEARQKAAAEREIIIKTARKLEAELVAKARKEAEVLVNAMQAELEKERAAGAATLNAYAAQMAREVALKVLERAA